MGGEPRSERRDAARSTVELDVQPGVLPHEDTERREERDAIEATSDAPGVEEIREEARIGVPAPAETDEASLRHQPPDHPLVEPRLASPRVLRKVAERTCDEAR